MSGLKDIMKEINLKNSFKYFSLITVLDYSIFITNILNSNNYLLKTQDFRVRMIMIDKK